MSEQNNITLDDLASMIKQGFDGVDKKFDEVHQEIHDVQSAVNNLSVEVNNRFNKIEGITLKDRVDLVELDVRRIKEALAM